MPAAMKKRKLMGEINVVPYIDVMLVLLIIFMVTAPLLTQGITVDLPKSGAEAIADTSDTPPLVISVNLFQYRKGAAQQAKQIVEKQLAINSHSSIFDISRRRVVVGVANMRRECILLFLEVGRFSHGRILPVVEIRLRVRAASS